MGDETTLKEKCEFLFQFYAYQAAIKSSPPALEKIEPTKLLDEGNGIKSKYLIRISDVYFLISDKKNKNVKEMLKYKSYASSRLKRIFGSILNPFDRLFIKGDYHFSRIRLGFDFICYNLSEIKGGLNIMQDGLNFIVLSYLKSTTNSEKPIEKTPIENNKKLLRNQDSSVDDKVLYRNNQ